MGKVIWLPVVLWLSACAAKHTVPAPAVFRIESREGGLHLIPPASPAGVAAQAVPLSQIIQNQYGFNPWEQYVNLSQDMRLSVQRNITPMTTNLSYYGIDSGGRRGFRVRSLPPEAEAFDKHARYLRLFYQTKFVKSPGQPLRPALFLWSDSVEKLTARTAQARDNPAFSCDGPKAECMAFPGKTTVSPEIRILVNQKARYVLLGSSVRDVLRADRVGDNMELHILRRHRNQLVPVTWQQPAFALALPLLAGDEMSW